MPRVENGEVPVVHMAELRDPDSCATFTSNFGRGLRDHGFIRVQGHGLSPAVLDEAYRACQEFFAQPMEAKRRLHVDGGAGQRGYTPFKAEHAKGCGVPDLKEFWHTGRELPEGHGLAALYAPNLWPEISGFKGSMLAMYGALEACAGELLGALTVFLDLPEGALTGLTRDGNSVLRALHYPPMDDHTFVPGAVRAAAHEDINLITLLVSSTASGLQLQRRDGSWLDINAQPGELVVDSGDILSRITNGYIPSTTHRVVNPAEGASGRFSMPFFMHPRPDAMLSVFPRFRQRGYPTPAADIVAGDFLAERLFDLGLA